MNKIERKLKLFSEEALKLNVGHNLLNSRLQEKRLKVFIRMESLISPLPWLPFNTERLKESSYNAGSDSARNLFQ